MCLYRIADINNMSPPELIDLLASLGLGTCYDPISDKRTAYINETGTFTRTGKTFVKIVVRVNNTSMYDYGAKLWVEDS